jgi:3-hydroxyacyl-CoA dehydrogenase
LFAEGFTNGNYHIISEFVRQFQKNTFALRHSYVPTIAAVQGATLGGGCELMMHCDRIVAALETNTGLVATSLGLIPSGGGIKEMVRRAATDSKGHLILPHLIRYFEQVASAKVSNSALEAREMGYLKPCDTIVSNAAEVLHVAKQIANGLYESGYRPPQCEENIPVLGKAGSTFIQVNLANRHRGHIISDHDYYVGSQLASLFSGGEVDEGQEVDDNWLLCKEHDVLMELVKTEKTQERIQHMIEKGRPLRN